MSARSSVRGLLAVTVVLLLGACSVGDPAPSVSATAPASTTDGTTTALPSPTTSSPHPSTTGSATCSQAARLAAWSVRRLAAQVLVAPLEMGDLAAGVGVVRAGVGGVILFGRTVPSDLGVRLRRLTAEAPDGVAPLVSTDEEGGAIQRLRGLVGEVPSAREMAERMTPASIEQLAATVGRRMRAAGVTMDLAPVLDLDDGPGPDATHPDGTRSFGTDPARTAADALAFARGLRSAGVVAVVKHFPGLGGASGNTDDMAATTLAWTTLRSKGLLPFETAIRAGIPAVMVANASVPGLTRLPASVSPTVITTVLRGDLGFDGLVVTDSLSAKALSAAGFDVPRAAVAAVTAGADLVLYGSGAPGSTYELGRVVDALVAAVASGRLPRERLESAAARVLAAKDVDLCRSSG